jgi:Icc-related predicted phosphoesterase
MPFGEPLLKNLVQTSRDEAKKLHDALEQLKTPTRVAVTHYSPIRATIVGEPETIYPFLGSTLLEQAFDREAPPLALHGHAHHGVFEGRTGRGVRVCNVALPILQSSGGETLFAIFDL